MTAAALPAEPESRKDSVLPLPLFVPTEVQVVSVIAVGCARAVVNVIGPAETLNGLERNLRFWAGIKVRTLGEEPCVNDRPLRQIGKDTSVFLSDSGSGGNYDDGVRDLPEGWVRRAFICDYECVGDLEYLARHELRTVVALLTLDDIPVEMGCIIGRTLVCVANQTLVAFPDPGALTGIIRREHGRLGGSDMVLRHLPGRVIHLDIRNGRGIEAEFQIVRVMKETVETGTVLVRNAECRKVSVEVDGIAALSTPSFSALPPVATPAAFHRTLPRDVFAEASAPGNDY